MTLLMYLSRHGGGARDITVTAMKVHVLAAVLLAGVCSAKVLEHSARIVKFQDNPARFHSEDKSDSSSSHQPVRFHKEGQGEFQSPSQPLRFHSENKSEFQASRNMKFHSEELSDVQQRTHKPLKFDTAGSSPAVAVHPYPYEDSAIDTFPYVASVTPSYTPPILQPGNSKLDPIGADHHGLHYPPSHGAWPKLARLLIAAVPIALFLAALPPNVVHINATQSVKPLGTTQQRQRSEAAALQTFPVLDMIERMGGLPALEHPGCEAHIFCQMTRLGATPEANTIQRFLWTTAHETPDSVAEMLGVRELLKAVRTDACSLYKCPKPTEAHQATN